MISRKFLFIFSVLICFNDILAQSWLAHAQKAAETHRAQGLQNDKQAAGEAIKKAAAVIVASRQTGQSSPMQPSEKKFLNTLAYQNLEKQLDHIKQQIGSDYETVYLSIPRDFVMKHSVAEDLQKYLASKGRPNAILVHPILADIAKHIGKPLQVEYDLSDVFMPNETQLILKRQKVFGPPSSQYFFLTHEELGISKRFLGERTLNALYHAVVNLTSEMDIAQNMLLILSIPKSKVDKYLYAHVNNHALLRINPNDNLDTFKQIVIQFPTKKTARENESEVYRSIELTEQEKNEEYDKAYKRYKGWIKGVGDEILNNSVPPALPPRDEVTVKPTLPQGPPPPIAPRKRVRFEEPLGKVLIEPAVQPTQIPQGPPPPVAPRKRVRFEEPLGRVQLEPAVQPQPAHMPPPPVPPRRTRIEPSHEEPAPGRQGLLEQIRKGKQLKPVTQQSKATTEEEQKVQSLWERMQDVAARAQATAQGKTKTPETTTKEEEWEEEPPQEHKIGEEKKSPEREVGEKEIKQQGPPPVPPRKGIGEPPVVPPRKKVGTVEPKGPDLETLITQGAAKRRAALQEEETPEEEWD